VTPDRSARGGDRRTPGRSASARSSTARRFDGPGRRTPRQPIERTESQAAYDGPPIPDDISGRELDRSAAAQLRSLPEKLANRVARHLVAAARTLHTDPDTAYAHAVAARARAARVAVVREAAGEAAYAAGRFKVALAEFKAARRIGGEPIYLPMMADCERAVGRPDRALALARDPAVQQLDETGRVEMLIVASGARRDQGDVAAALRTLEVPELRSRSRASWAPRIRYAYAEALLADGQVQTAREWFERAAGLDPDGLTDAAERVAELERADDA
jgi:tetratricopeptide (TPR) repeat protein